MMFWIVIGYVFMCLAEVRRVEAGGVISYIHYFDVTGVNPYRLPKVLVHFRRSDKNFRCFCYVLRSIDCTTTTVALPPAPGPNILFEKLRD